MTHSFMLLVHIAGAHCLNWPWNGPIDGGWRIGFPQQLFEGGKACWLNVGSHPHDALDDIQGEVPVVGHDNVADAGEMIQVFGISDRRRSFGFDYC